MALLDDVMYDGGHIKEEDKIGVERGELRFLGHPFTMLGFPSRGRRVGTQLTIVMSPIKVRLEALRRKMDTRDTGKM